MTQDIYSMISGFMASQALHVAAKLAVLDLLRDGPKTASEIAKATGTHEESLRRLLSFLTGVDVLREDDQGRFTSTKNGDLLRSDHPASMRPWALLLGEPFIWSSWGNLFEAVHTGKPGFNHAHGQDFFDYLHGHPGAAAIFNAAMSGSSAHECAAILDAYDFHGLSKIVDVGGGQGTLLKSILTRHPDARGTLCDLPSVIATAHSMRDPEIASRCDVVGIDFFQNVPAGGDAYILKKIVHDWNDAEVICLLRNCRSAISVDGKLLVIESIIKTPNQPDPAKWKDLNMLALVAGRERTLEEFGSLFLTAGFKVGRVVEAGNLAIITGLPV